MESLSENITKKIKRNIRNNNNKDVKENRTRGTLTYQEFIDKILQQDNKCYVCLQKFKYDGGNWCYFFPSADRIYNYASHSKENIGISCLFCNIRMFKQVSIKKCGLCEGLNHTYSGDIITKSSLFQSLGNDNYRIMEYIRRLNVNSSLLLKSSSDNNIEETLS